MDYFQRLKEIQLLQWELFIDYWFLHIGVLIVGVGLLLFWILKK
ncbi:MULTISPECIES: hypothetical protein [unclassified Rossellomorea]|nr:hypothetical protein [uncultured Rossellomorea sp.]